MKNAVRKQIDEVSKRFEQTKVFLRVPPPLAGFNLYMLLIRYLYVYHTNPFTDFIKLPRKYPRNAKA